jgi:ribonuclease E
MVEPTDGNTDDTFSEEDESDEQPAFAGADQGQNGERRPRRRGRRGGRRRRGGREEGLAGSISDELAPPPAIEVTDAVADFDGGSEPAPSPVQQPEPAAPAAFEPETAEQPQPAVPPPPAEEEPVADEKAARRRSTVREKVSFMSSPPPDTAPATPAAVEHAAPAQASEETAPSGDQPRKAGWWSRRFGGG